jgi:hypothetical protein
VAVCTVAASLSLLNAAPASAAPHVPLVPPTTTVAWTEADPSGVAVRTMDTAGTVTTVAVGPFNDPVAVGGDGTVYVTDNSNVLAYAPGATSPVTLGTGLSAVIDIAVNSSGNVYVADFWTAAVYEVDAGAGVASAVLQDPGVRYRSIEVDADDDLVAIREPSSYVPSSEVLVERPAGGGPTRTVASVPSAIGVAVAPDGSLVVAARGAAPTEAELRHLSPDGTWLGTTTAEGDPFHLGAGPNGSIYLAGSGGGVFEHFLTYGGTRTLVGTGGGVFAVAAAPAWIRRPPVKPERHPTPTPTPAPVATLTRVQPRLGASRLVVRAEHLVPGEPYEIRLRGLIRHRGVVGADGVVEEKVRVSTRLSGTRRLKVVGAVSGVMSMAFDVDRGPSTRAAG